MKREAAQSHLKPPKATAKPDSRHILGIDSGVQSHTKATPRLHQGSTKATLQPPQSHPKATLMRPSSHLQARCKPGAASSSADREPSRFAAATRAHGRSDFSTIL